jgi:hypothetical protein
MCTSWSLLVCGAMYKQLHAKLWHCACGHVVSCLLCSVEHECLRAISNTFLKLDGHVQQHVQQEWAAGMWCGHGASVNACTPCLPWTTL